ncbi:hypothetical protein LNP25_23760 [Klebsiella variicola subsp. variicola]|nr:hypothetical protein [Klebsiella variicola subsp. variicola]
MILFISGDWPGVTKKYACSIMFCAGDRGYLSRRGFADPAESLGKMGYLFRMLTWTIQASFITLSLYRVWTRPWFCQPVVAASGDELLSSPWPLMSC